MADRICIFAGTTEGRKLAALLGAAAEVTVCVATEYGEVVLNGIPDITVHTGRMDEAEMTAFFREQHFDRILDATHPYATAVTANIRAAAAAAGVPLMRIRRETALDGGNAVYVSSAEEARDYLKTREGSILITTGAKELSSYTGLDMQRVWARVLPLPSSLEACEKAGIPVAHIIAAQGPFTEEVDFAELRMIGASYLVTKASGKAGGFEEKIRAAALSGAVPVVIGEKTEEEGLTLDEAVRELAEHYPLAGRKILLIGIGPGDPGLRTNEAIKALKDCDAVIGARSVAETLEINKPCYFEYLPEKVRAVLDAHPSIRKAAVVLRGDTGFYSGAKKLLEAFEGEQVRVLPGISCAALFAARLNTGWEDAAFVSVHGREGKVVHAVSGHRKTFILTGGENTPDTVLKRLLEYGFGDLKCAVGERLSYPEEKITEGTVEVLSEGRYDALSLLYIENPEAGRSARFGIPDEEFIRGSVPMTRSEVRAVSLSRLALGTAPVVYDVGAGTGSVSVECALNAPDGQVYAIERETEALELIRANQMKFRAENITVVEGAAPEALDMLPVPTHAFIGGSGGRLKEILELLLRKNPDVRIVLNTVTLESQTEAYELIKAYGFTYFDAVTVNIARSKKLGRYHMMSAENPVTVFVMQGGRSDD